MEQSTVIRWLHVNTIDNWGEGDDAMDKSAGQAIYVKFKT